jgi:tRNA(fMet)-specific endonuclease VapC
VKYLIDTDWLIDATTGRLDAQRTLSSLSDDGLAVSILTVAELYEGAFRTPDPSHTLAGMREFLGDYGILPVTDSIAETFAGERANLRRLGQLIPDMDLLIAATARSYDLTLLTRNIRHFARIPGLRIYFTT